MACEFHKHRRVLNIFLFLPFAGLVSRCSRHCVHTDPNQLVQFCVDFFTPHSSFSWEYFNWMGYEFDWPLCCLVWSRSCWTGKHDILSWSWTPIVLLGHLEQPVAHTMPVMPAVLVALASTNKILRSAYHLDFKTCMAQKGARKLWLRMQRAKYSVFSPFCQNNIRGLDGLLTPSQEIEGALSDTNTSFLHLQSEQLCGLRGGMRRSSRARVKSFNIKRTKKQNSWRRKHFFLACHQS